jgi:hypothetical protein
VRLDRPAESSRQLHPIESRVADPMGRFRFDGLQAGSYRVSWRRSAEVQVAEGETARVDIQEQTRPMIHGRILLDGTTRIGARVFAPWWIDEFGFERRDSVDPEAERGRFHVELPGPGRFALYARDERLGRMSPLVFVEMDWGEVRVVDLELGSRRVTGVLVDSLSGEPVEGAQVMLGSEKNRPLLARTTTDAAGGFELNGLSAGRYFVRFFHPAYLLHDSDPLVVPLSGDIDLGRVSIEASSLLSITILDPEGDPIDPLVTLYVVDEAREQLLETYRRVPGRAQRPPIFPPGRYWALALPGRPSDPDAWRGYAHGLREFELRAGDRDAIEISVLR